MNVFFRIHTLTLSWTDLKLSWSLGQTNWSLKFIAAAKAIGNALSSTSFDVVSSTNQPFRKF